MAAVSTVSRLSLACRTSRTRVRSGGALDLLKGAPQRHISVIFSPHWSFGFFHASVRSTSRRGIAHVALSSSRRSRSFFSLTPPETGSSMQEPGPSKQEQAVNNLLYNIPRKRYERKQRHILSALVSNEPGVLSLISGILAGRGFNIDSLVVSETEVSQLSRMTVVFKAGQNIEQARKQLQDLVCVWAVLDMGVNVSYIERELLIIKLSLAVPGLKNSLPNAAASVNKSPFVSVNEQQSREESIFDNMAQHVRQHSLVELTGLFQGKVLDVATDHIMIELCAKASRIDAFIQLCRPFGIVECARSGVLAMQRGHLTGFEEEGSQNQTHSSTVDESELPPG